MITRTQGACEAPPRRSALPGDSRTGFCDDSPSSCRPGAALRCSHPHETGLSLSTPGAPRRRSRLGELLAGMASPPVRAAPAMKRGVAPGPAAAATPTPRSRSIRPHPARTHRSSGRGCVLPLGRRGECQGMASQCGSPEQAGFHRHSSHRDLIPVQHILLQPLLKQLPSTSLRFPLSLPKPQCFYSPKHLRSVLSVPEPGDDLAMDLPVRQTCTCLTAGSAHPWQAQLNQHNLPLSLQPPWPSSRACCHGALQNTCHKPSTEVEGNL